MKNKKVLCVCFKHEYYTLQALFDSVTSDFHRIESPEYYTAGKKTFITQLKRIQNILLSIKIPKADVYLINDPSSIFFIKVLYPKAKVVLYIDSSYYPSIVSNTPPRNYSNIEKSLVKMIHPYIVDGAIAVSQYIKDDSQKILKCPIKVANCSFIMEYRYNKLLSIKPKLNNHKILYIASKRDNFRDDILIDAFKIIKKQVKDAELYMLGKDHSKELEQIDGIHVEGFRNDIETYLEKCSITVFPGFGQPCYTAVIESLLAGVPTFISNTMGLSDIVRERIHPCYVRDMSSIDFAEGIIFHMNECSLSMKEIDSSLAKEVGKDFSEEKAVARFKDCFESLVV